MMTRLVPLDSILAAWFQIRNASAADPLPKVFGRSPTLLSGGSASAPLKWQNHTPEKMPGWPVPEGQKCITISLPTELVTHLDDRSTHLCCSRAAYLRQLIVLDRERQAGKA